jgi:hypothetical protein
LVEILSEGKKGSGFVVNSKQMIGLGKEEGEWARCASEKVECYSIQIEEFGRLFPTISMKGLKRSKMIT